MPRDRSSRRMASALAAIGLALVLLAPPAGAAVSPQEGDTPRPGAGLVDRDRNGISDDLQAKLPGVGRGERLSVIVTFDGPGDATSAQRAVGSFRVTRQFALIRGFAAEMTRAQIEALATRAEVFRIEEDFEVRTTMSAADADFGTSAARASFGVDGSGVEVCVIDTGVDPNHEQLDSKAPIAFFDAVNGRTTPYDDHGHGTHVASIAVGDRTGGADAAVYGGVAPGAGLSAAKVLSSFGSGTASQIIAGIDWCAARPAARVLSMSLGTQAASDGNDSISQAVNSAVQTKGKVVVVAAGNSGDAPQTVGSPGAATHALTVGAVAEHSATPGTANHSPGVYLAYFSSRGPTLDGRTKPDVIAPGVTLTAAKSGTASGYATYSGTSMATPFVSGTVALALQSQPSWTPAQVRSAVEGTARDRGPSGKDDDWGAGLLDGYAVAASANGAAGSTAFPAHTRFEVTIADHETWTTTFDLGETDLSTPIAATILIEGAPTCVFWWVGFCFDYNWGPDLDAELLDPTGKVISASTCGVGTECGGSKGRQETLRAMPTVAGTYTIRVYPYEGDPFYGQGGTFGMDLSAGAPFLPPAPPADPGPGPEPEPEPEPEPQTPTMHVGDLTDRSYPQNRSWWNARVEILVHDGSREPLSGAQVAVKWESGHTSTCTTGVAGTCSVERRVSTKKMTFWAEVTGLSAAGYEYVFEENDETKITLMRP